MDETLIIPQYFRINEADDAALAVYDYRISDANPDQTFRILLNGTELCSCNTKEGFLLRILLPLGIYRVTLEPRGKSKFTIETVAHIKQPGEYGLRVWTSPSLIGFDELIYNG